MVAHDVRARGRYLIVCAESDYSTCDRPPSVARVGVVGATISGWFGLVNPLPVAVPVSLPGFPGF